MHSCMLNDRLDKALDGAMALMAQHRQDLSSPEIRRGVITTSAAGRRTWTGCWSARKAFPNNAETVHSQRFGMMAGVWHLDE